MPVLDFKQNYFQLFELPQQFELDREVLGSRYRQLQQQLHPDRYAHTGDHQQRVAVQYSSLVNQAFQTLSRPLPRALYLLELAGMSGEQVAAEPVDGGFLIEQMELREKLESIEGLVDPDSVLEHLLSEIADDIAAHQQEFSRAFAAGDLNGAARACVKMQYLNKLQQEAEVIESALLD